MKKTFLLLSLLAALFVPSVASAQFITHFTTYTAQSLNMSTGSPRIVQTVTLSGYTQVPAGMPTSGARHTPSVMNRVNTVGGLTSGASGCPTCQMYATSTITADLGNLIDDDNEGSAVQCSIAGTFFAYTHFTYIHSFYEHTQTTGNNGLCPGPSCVANERMLCYPPQSTMQVGQIIVPDTRTPPSLMPAPQYDNWGVGFSFTGTAPWYFLPLLIVSTQSFNPGTVPCTVVP